MTNNEILTRFAGMTGPELFNKFVRSLSRSVAKKRLEFWQEKLLSEARQQGIPVPVLFQDVIDFFATAETLKIALSFEEFQTDPLKFLGYSDYIVPEAWIHDCVQNPEVREYLSSLIARSVSKVGSFELALVEVSLLARNSTADEALSLYCYVRDESMRLEDEWWPAFEKAFPATVGLLPPTRPWPT
jgi:hypothetical protein